VLTDFEATAFPMAVRPLLIVSVASMTWSKTDSDRFSVGHDFGLGVGLIRRPSLGDPAFIGDDVLRNFVARVRYFSSKTAICNATALGASTRKPSRIGEFACKCKLIPCAGRTSAGKGNGAQRRADTASNSAYQPVFARGSR
jgi:hypothetical protein